MSWKTPENVKDIQMFIGLASYYRQYLKSFSTIAAPLIKLTRKHVNFEWTDQCETAFRTIKQALCEAPVLAYPKPGLPYILDCDVSDLGVGGIISQVQDGKERVISYASKKTEKGTTKIQRNQKRITCSDHIHQSFSTLSPRTEVSPKNRPWIPTLAIRISRPTWTSRQMVRSFSSICLSHRAQSWI
jgi:hypothetical protein